MYQSAQELLYRADGEIRCPILAASAGQGQLSGELDDVLDRLLVAGRDGNVNKNLDSDACFLHLQIGKLNLRFTE